MYTHIQPIPTTIPPLETVGITPTLELRWFRRGSIPAEVLHWSQVDCPGQRLQTQRLYDRYLYTPGCDEISLKLRHGKVELKHYQGTLAMPQYGSDTSMMVDFWEGQSEQWLKWSYPIAPAFSNPDETDIFQGQPWIKVQKKRWQNHYQGVDIELAQITVESERWWSIALEAEPQTDQPDSWFSEMVSEIGETYRGPALLAQHCYAYPAWLSKHFTVAYPSPIPLNFCQPLRCSHSI